MKTHPSAALLQNSKILMYISTLRFQSCMHAHLFEPCALHMGNSSPKHGFPVTHYLGFIGTHICQHCAAGTDRGGISHHIDAADLV